jgi:hypothetical protein
MPGSFKKLTITAVKLNDDGEISSTGTSFELMINPAQYTHTRNINYSNAKPMGAIGQRMPFGNIDAEQISFDEIVLDGTGVVPPSLSGNKYADVKKQMDTLCQVIYTYDGQVHQPNHVRLLWGSLIFFGRLTSMTTTYTLFKPSGQPLRARLKMDFAGSMSTREEALRTNRSSPDLSHTVTVVAGDTLPLLCYRIYGDSAYYSEVASANRVTNFRRLKPGTVLKFPPLV